MCLVLVRGRVGGRGNAKPMEDALVLAQVPSEADAKHRLVQEVQEVPER